MSSSAEQPPVRRPRRSILLVLMATAVSGASGFVTLLIVAPVLGPAGYASFSMYWAVLFMVVGVLFGVQQETTRAVSDAGEYQARPGDSSVIRFSGALGLAVLVLLVATALIWAEPVFGAGNGGWALPLAIGAASYVSVAALNGILAGSGHWGGFAAVPFIDALLRLLLVAVVLWMGADGTALAWAVAIPFPVSLLVVGSVWWTVVRSRSRVREPYRAFAFNASRTIVASTANAVLVTGFPVILSLMAGGDRAALGVVVLALTLSRAPILVPLTVLQSMLIARFSASPKEAPRLMAIAVAALAVATPVIGAVAGLWGASVLTALFGEQFAVPGALLTWLVIASGCLGLLTITGARVLAAGHHTVFATGWVLACVLAVATVAFTPGDVGVRTVVGLVVGPLIGAGWHLLFGRRR